MGKRQFKAPSRHRFCSPLNLPAGDLLDEAGKDKGSGPDPHETIGVLIARARPGDSAARGPFMRSGARPKEALGRAGLEPATPCLKGRCSAT
jgi:hypothetical protein